MSVSGRCSGISRADGRNASLEHIMVEFTASTCPSLRGKPRLFFLQHFKGTSWVNDECSVFASRSFTEKDTVRLLCIFTSEKDSCPEEADFLRICVTSTYPADQPNREPGSFFYPAEGSVIISSSPGGRGAGGFLGGESRCFQGRKDGSQSSLTEHHERLLKIDCKWGGIIGMLRGHRGIR